MKNTRRRFIKQAMTTAALPLVSFSLTSAAPYILSKPLQSEKRRVYVFSKHLQWLDYKHMAEFVAECGFDGADITVRPGGHVEPRSVAEDLPKAVAALKAAGKDASMITTAIQKAEDPHAYATLRTAARLGVKSYRMGWYEYPGDKNISFTLQNLEVELQKLASLNKQLKIVGDYQNHAGDGVGSSVWDFGMLLNKVNSPWLGMQYDVRHAMVEGANSWVRGFEFVKSHIHTLDVKDFTWSQEENGKYVAKTVPLGKGQVDFDTYFQLISALPSTVPICLHFEYDLGGAEHGNQKVSMEAKEILGAMKTDLAFVRERI